MSMEYLVMIVGMGVVTYVPRWIPFYLFAKRRPPGWLVEWLTLVPASILSAVLLPALVTGGQPRQIDLLRPEMWVALPTFAVAVFTRSLGGTVIVGMGLFWLVGRLGC